MNWPNIIVANIGWAPAYEGEQIESSHSYVLEHGTGAEAYNFRAARDGLFYGYVRGGSALGAHDSGLWTVVFVSNRLRKNPLPLTGQS